MQAPPPQLGQTLIATDEMCTTANRYRETTPNDTASGRHDDVPGTSSSTMPKWT